MAKDPIDNGNNINAADVVENSYLPSGSVPTSYPVYAGNATIDGDPTTHATSSIVDLKDVHALSSLVFKVSSAVSSFNIYISTSETDDSDAVSWENIASTCSLNASTNTIT